jgi:hypothetical protein
MFLVFFVRRNPLSVVGRDGLYRLQPPPPPGLYPLPPSLYIYGLDIPPMLTLKKKKFFLVYKEI